MATKSKTIVLSLSAADCYELVKKLGHDRRFKENESNGEGIIWTAQNYTLETWITPISDNKTEVEIIASSGALFDMFGHLDQHIKIFAAQLKNRKDKATNTPREQGPSPMTQIKTATRVVDKDNNISSKGENKEVAKKHFDQSYEYWKKSKYEKALEECDKAIELAPDWSEAHNLCGVIFEEMNKRDKSLIEYREAVRLDPDNKDAMENLAYVAPQEAAAVRQAAEAAKPTSIQQNNTYKLAYGMVYFIGGLNFVLGLVTVLFNIDFLRQIYNGPYLIILGLVFFVLGFFVQKKSIIALILAITIYGLDGLVGSLTLILQGSFLGFSTLLPRIIFIMPMIQGVAAIKALNQKNRRIK